MSIASRLISAGEWATHTSDRLAYLAGVIILPLIPYVVVRSLLQLSQDYLPLLLHVLVICVFFACVGLVAWLISGDRGEKFFTGLYRNGVKWPLLFSFVLLLSAMPVFAAISVTLQKYGQASFDPPLPTELSPVMDFYAWHFFNSIPAFDVTEALLWKRPYQYTDRLSGLVLVAFKVMVILPVIGSFVMWNDVRKRIQEADTKVPPP